MDPKNSIIKGLHCILICKFICSFNSNGYNCALKAVFTRAQWLSGRVLDLIPRGCVFEPHRHHCVVSLSKAH